MGFTASGIWTPEEGDSGKPHIYLATMAQSIDDGIGADTGWVDVVVNAPYAALNPTEKPQVRKIMGKVVVMRGAVSGAGITANASLNNVLQIPAAYTPSVNTIIRLGTSGGASTATSNVTSNGACTLRTNGVVSGYYFWQGIWFTDK